MYRLYGGELGDLKLIKKSDDEKEIINNLGKRISEYEYIYYFIIKEENNQDIPYKFITSLEEYSDYIEEFEINQIKALKFKKTIDKN